MHPGSPVHFAEGSCGCVLQPRPFRGKLQLWQQHQHQLALRMQAMEEAVPFLEAVDASDVPDYYDVIKVHHCALRPCTS